MTASPPCADASVLILAAGASSRMRGADKLMEHVAGVPLIRHAAAQALASGLAVTVVLPPDRPARAAALDGLPVATVVARDARSGMGASLAAGAAAAPRGALIVLLADLPEITGDDLRHLADAAARHPGRTLRATAADGTPGHPVLFPAPLRPALLDLHGDQGARDILRAHPPVPVALPGRHAVTDLDTPEDWAAWRAATGR